MAFECICFKEISVIFFVNFLCYFSQFLRILSKYRSIFLPYRVQSDFVADCFNGRFSCFWYYEFL